MNTNTFKLKKSDITRIIKEEVQRLLAEADDPSTTQIREATQHAISNLDQHVDLLQAIVTHVSMGGGDNHDILELIKAHGTYRALLERALETLH